MSLLTRIQPTPAQASATAAAARPLRGHIPQSVADLMVARRFALAYGVLAFVFACALVFQINPFHAIPPVLRLPVMAVMLLLSVASLISFCVALRTRAVEAPPMQVVEEAGRVLALQPSRDIPLWAEPLRAYAGIRLVRLSRGARLPQGRGQWAVRFEHSDSSRCFLCGPHWTREGAQREATQMARRFGLDLL